MIINPSKRLQGIEEYYFSQKLKQIAAMRAQGKDVINLGIGSPDLPPSEPTIKALIEHSRNPSNHAYQGYVGLPELRRAFSKWYGEWFDVKLNPDTEVLPLIGSKEGIMHISMAFIDSGDKILVPNPGYPTYRAASMLAGGVIEYYDLQENKGWLPDLDALSQQDLTTVKIMWVNYPNMPTGAKADRTFFEELIAFGKQHQILICNDNPYAFILNDAPMSILSVPGSMEVAIELNSLSKSHNMAGWRVGMLAGNADYLQTVLKFKSNMDSGMFKPVQLATVAALDNPPQWYTELNTAYRERRDAVYELLELLGCKYDKHQVGMFVWASIPEKYMDGFELSDEILEDQHVFITPGGIFGDKGNRYIRISLCSEIKVLEEAIGRVKEGRR